MILLHFTVKFAVKQEKTQMKQEEAHVDGIKPGKGGKDVNFVYGTV